MDRILITGGAGAIGSNLAKALLRCRCYVTIVDDLSAAPRWNVPQGTEFIEGSILDEEVLKRAFSGHPQIVYHLAAHFANQNSVDHPETDLMVNGLGTLKVLQFAELARADRFIYASSGCSIYGSNHPLPLREDYVSLRLSTPYQITKMLGELYCNYFAHQYGIQVVKPRFFNSYGPGEIPGPYRNVIPNFIALALRHRPLPITGTGEETRDFTFVEDIVNALLASAKNKEVVGKEFNLASGVETRIIDLAQKINLLCKNDRGVEYLPRRHWDTKPRLLADITRARSLGWSPTTSLDEGLEKTVDWFYTVAPQDILHLI